ncbi:MAG: hypothetical protein EOO31_06635 [Comamonadaceae bacterium]|nr:MAG: hypothetical protein EOO31_06635 [Comamonadaceae bacterium]
MVQVAIIAASDAEAAALAKAVRDSLATHWETRVDEAPVRVALQVRPALQQWALRAADGRSVRTSARSADLLDASASAADVAANHKASFALTLLLGQDSAFPAPADDVLRGALLNAGVPFQVLYGSPSARARQALEAIATISGHRRAVPPTTTPDQPQRLRSWGCEKCSDPECEHALFQRLLQSR